MGWFALVGSVYVRSLLRQDWSMKSFWLKLISDMDQFVWYLVVGLGGFNDARAVGKGAVRVEIE